MRLISIVMPTLNRAPVLGAAIRSVLDQTYSNFELIVVDDGSEDATAVVVGSFTDGRLIYLCHRGRHGGNWARNRGIERARGGIICFLDSDDVYLPHKLSTVADFFAKNPSVDVLVDSYVMHKDPEGKGKGKSKEKVCANPVLRSSEEFRAGVFERTVCKATPSVSVRRSALLDIGMFDETLQRRQDMDLVLRLSRAHTCNTIGEITWVKHVAADSISRRPNFLPATIEICKRHPDYLTEYREPLEREVRRHLRRMLRRGRWRVFARDVASYRSYDGFDKPLLRLLLGG